MTDNAITKNLQNGTLEMQDGAGTPSELTVPVDEGDFEYTVRPREAIPIYNRGVLTSFTQGPENAVTFSFSMKFREWGSRTLTGAPIAVAEFGSGVGSGSSLTSTLTCGPFCVDLIWHIAVNCTAAEDQNEDVTLPDSHFDEWSVAEGAEYNTIRSSGKSLTTWPTSVRSAAT